MMLATLLAGSHPLPFRLECAEYVPDCIVDLIVAHMDGMEFLYLGHFEAEGALRRLLSQETPVLKEFLLSNFLLMEPPIILPPHWASASAPCPQRLSLDCTVLLRGCRAGSLRKLKIRFVSSWLAGLVAVRLFELSVKGRWALDLDKGAAVFHTLPFDTPSYHYTIVCIDTEFPPSITEILPHCDRVCDLRLHTGDLVRFCATGALLPALVDITVSQLHSDEQGYGPVNIRQDDPGIRAPVLLSVTLNTDAPAGFDGLVGALIEPFRSSRLSGVAVQTSHPQTFLRDDFAALAHVTERVGIRDRAGVTTHVFLTGDEGNSCRPPTTPDRRTAAGREDSGLAAQISSLKDDNNILAQENALLRAELANRDHGLVFAVSQPASLEAFNDSSYGAPAASSILLPGNSPEPAPSTFAPPYSAQSAPFAHSVQGGTSSHPAPPAPPIGPLILGPDFDCIGDMFDEAALFPFGHYGPYATGAGASRSSLDT
ncbi:hypothetical protein AURDEDRAFT_175828 [Auricularia subglabra TFB-10046 SS5]|uniref:Uncharacterized protein n=1 Tax=Auricularia subglabra (strain TFB-10046 / SS5) TaxID=717982 RepID=J0CWP5_AURST|nr:hypothetical protein AURDEDRAFT_175828 [Auricularia subglabra TFB-10046 SS5]